MKKKYIISLDDRNVWTCGLPAKTLLLSDVSIFGTDLASVNTCIELTPYTEPDTEQVRKEAYDKGYDDATAEIGSDEQAIAEKAYQKGLSDAWEAARKIGSNSMCSLKEMGFDFTRCAVPDYNPSWFVVKNYSAQEAIEEIRAYEQAQKEKEKEEKEEKDSVTTEEVMRRYLDKFCKRNFCTKCLLHTPDFTCGRGYHFLTNHPVSDEEVRRAYAAVLAKL